MALEPIPSKSDGEATVEDYRALDDGERYELIRGNLVVTPAPSFEHQVVAHELVRRIGSHVRDGDLGYCVEAPVDVVLSDDTVLQPDLLFVSHERFSDVYDGHGLSGAPDLVVEILSPGTVKRDRIEKMDLYADAGVPWLLLVDPGERFVEVFELDAASGTYRREGRASDDESLSCGLFPDLRIDLAEVWFDPPSGV